MPRRNPAVHVIRLRRRFGDHHVVLCTCGEVSVSDERSSAARQHDDHVLMAIRVNRAEDKAVAR